MSDGSDDPRLAGRGDETADTMRGRAGESRLKLRLLLRTNRLAVTGALAAAVFVAFVAAGASVDPSFRATVADSSVLDYLFSSMLGALVTGVTLVVTINQLVLSQELGPLGDQHRRMSDTMDVRTYAAELLGETTPADPSTFLRDLLRSARDRAETLRAAVAADRAGDLGREVDVVVDDVADNAASVADRLDAAEFGTFEVVFAALDFDYSWAVFHVERLRDEYDLSDEEDAALDDLRTALVMFAPAREHVKTLYFQWALVDLSRLIVYAAVPALVVSGIGIAFLGAETFPGATLGVGNLLWVVAAGFTVTLVPFLLLVSYILRIATVAKRTLAIGPLVLRDSRR
ncbi:hypothetical protein [Halorussus halobius]|uniref:hypothetical protein n=1 Tax=Halorussus halobius TaxID=1710537 RepID=UPI001092B13D|nr:hypothetical protein [Halorussus halobius]